MFEICNKFRSTGKCRDKCAYAHLDASGNIINNPTATKLNKDERNKGRKRGRGGGGGAAAKTAKTGGDDAKELARFNAFMVNLKSMNADNEILNSVVMPSFPIVMHFGRAFNTVERALDIWNNGTRFGVGWSMGWSPRPSLLLMPEA